ncbi:predicted protein [Aspergillus nidulans FGSC A4]|uniref:Uncharacterized protein n=1 Tax=Emericella nidulans (strain FGSC A4 / ATCC 38163 / CBS 112.46 / NRRL 194 / M139) TaxID=227321 RepID=Q5AWW5_EMENI|nr:hypothetical protein [Aspergillus nidulans FGSC A4]EAA61262.1 predicted protein [Aspergillus nidulans FGSC A4]CBF78844.1 TPA: conserved hypothetical protein [Aspergillus nidulans FGSC A4]|eukprot:XP_680484.1 predicted protein [Aspergillus nidulans FGSC A4]
MVLLYYCGRDSMIKAASRQSVARHKGTACLQERMRFFTTTALFALLATSTLANPIEIRQAANTRTVTLTNENSGHGQSSDIPTDGVDVAIPPRYPDLYSPTFRVDSVMITAGVVEGAKCVVSGNRVSDNAPVTLVTVDGRKNYAKFPQGVAKPESLKINCV